ncbi:hypothetical protein L218DRAFT_1009258 [Marasmius fiardii PR-910]|nr:hypothetical protein L218DRAFT_1009258 [Marasmius fiardii PR-910]
MPLLPIFYLQSEQCLAVRGDSKRDKENDDNPDPWGSTPEKFTSNPYSIPDSPYHLQNAPPPGPLKPYTGRRKKPRNGASTPYHDHSHYPANGSSRYAQCAEIWDKHASRWMTFDPKDAVAKPVVTHEQQNVYFCVTARYNDHWSEWSASFLSLGEPYNILTHFSEPLLSFVNVVCWSYGSWGGANQSSNEIEIGQALRTLKKTKAKLEEIGHALSNKTKRKSVQDKLALVRSLGNMAVDKRTPEVELNQYLKNLETQLKAFVAYLEKKFKPIADRLASAIHFGYMEFDLLPYYFEPGQDVWFSSFEGIPLAMRVNRVNIYGDSFSSPGVYKRVNQVAVEGNGYAWNGTCFSTVYLKSSCFKFTGSQELSKLPVQLLTPEKREELTARGRRYKAEAGINYRICGGVSAFDGLAVVHCLFFVLSDYQERIVIDRLGFLDAQAQETNRKSKKQRSDGWEDRWEYGTPPQPNPLPLPPPAPDRRWASSSSLSLPLTLEDDSLVLPRRTNGKDIPDEMLCYLPVELYGYNLARKEWQSFELNSVKPVEYDSKAWDHLVLDANVKTLIKGLVEVSTKATAASGALVDDVIARKGGGMTSVLYGPPGTGKTLTAEAVSELLRRPLLTVGSSDLPRDPSGMEDTLRYVLKLATSWDAVLLIDEADVFLEQRSLHEIERNALVSVALRVLEYHRGVVFLTTNRIKVFDEAFLSRFSIAVKYPELNKAGRYLIWSRFLELAGYKIVSSPFVTNDDLNEKIIPRQSIEELAAKSFNGRTIKNLVRTAQALALSQNSHLKMDHIHIVVRAQEKFLEDFAVERISSSSLDCKSTFAIHVPLHIDIKRGDVGGKLGYVVIPYRNDIWQLGCLLPTSFNYDPLNREDMKTGRVVQEGRSVHEEVFDMERYSYECPNWWLHLKPVVVMVGVDVGVEFFFFRSSSLYAPRSFSSRSTRL